MASLKDRIEGLRKAFEDGLLKAGDARSLEELRTAFLSRKKGHVTLLFEDLKSAAAEEKREAGRLVNEFKNFVVVRLDGLEAGLRTDVRPARPVDLTLPGRKRYVGTPHPLTLFQEEIEAIFLGMGFSIEEGPEIETDYYNFEALNFPPHHPARDSWDTFYITDDLLLRTHTSPVQIRVMERSKPPIRIVCPGRVFRRETPDPTHLPMFMQIEGLVVDEGITMAHLKGTLDHFAASMFGEGIVTRLRPSYFPFTEPSAEVDLECFVCRGASVGNPDRPCRTCSSEGWIEWGGCGMVNPRVLTACGIDAARYTGFAFGMGIERTLMFRHGVTDMRDMVEGDIRFTTAFGSEV